MLVLGQHLDDCAETLMMSLFHNGTVVLTALSRIVTGYNLTFSCVCCNRDLAYYACTLCE